MPDGGRKDAGTSEGQSSREGQASGKPTKTEGSEAEGAKAERAEIEKFRGYTVQKIYDLPPPEWLVEDIIPAGCTTVLYGMSGCGKTFLALDIALTVASGGSEVLGHKVCKSGPVAYIYSESPRGLRIRLEAWKERHKGDLSDFRTFLTPLDWFDPGGDVNRFSAVLTDMFDRSPSLIVLDTLARCFGADRDENGTKDMAGFVAGCHRLLCDFPEAALLIIHHTGKDGSKGARGAYALKAAIDAELELSKPNPHAGKLKLRCKKMRDGEDGWSLHFALETVELPGGRSSCVLIEGKEADFLDRLAPTTNKSDEAALEALRSFGDEGARFTEWRGKSELRRSTFKTVRTRLLSADLIRKDDGRYFVTEEGPGPGLGPGGLD